MLYYPFKDYDEFRRIFPVEETNSGKKVRRNGMLLNFYKNGKLLHESARNGEKFPNVKSVAEMEIAITSKLFNHYGNEQISLLGNFFSDVYHIDVFGGICQDGDAKSVRYVLKETDRTYKMKATKFFSKIMQENDFCKLLDFSVRNYIAADVLAKRWEAHASEIIAKLSGADYELHVDDEFWKIYDSCYCKGGLDSCMTDKNLHRFYENSVAAKAAYLTNEDNYIVARAIIFTDARDENGNRYRLCERQYSSSEDELLKRALVNKLIAADKIDGYKKIGAGCSDAQSFVSNAGEDWSDKEFEIGCDLDYDNDLSYQDSFKYYDMNTRTAYNYWRVGCNWNLDTAEGRLGNGNYDEYHDTYTSNDVVPVYYGGEWIDCDEEDLDDFIYFEDGFAGEGYYHVDYIYFDTESRDWVLEEKSCFDLTTTVNTKIYEYAIT